MFCVCMYVLFLIKITIQKASQDICILLLYRQQVVLMSSILVNVFVVTIVVHDQHYEFKENFQVLKI